MTGKARILGQSTIIKWSSQAKQTNLATKVGSKSNNSEYADDSNGIMEELSFILSRTHQKETQTKLMHLLRLILTRDVTAVERKIINSFDVEWLYDTIVSAEKGDIICDYDFQLEYGNFLLKFVDFSLKFHDKVRTGLKLFVTELISRNKKLNDTLVKNIWEMCERHLFIWTDLIKLILPFSKLVIEEKTFEWLSVPVKSRYKHEFYAEMSYHCEELFVMIVTIVNQFVILSEGNERVLSFADYFVSYVDERCNTKKTIFSFYPKEYFRIVSLLGIPPEIYPDKPSKPTEIIPSKLDVLGLLYTKYKEDRSMILLLLTHFPKWLGRFANLLKSVTDAPS